MNKKIILSLLALVVSLGVYSQKYAYVDTEYIMDNIPEYKDAQLELNDIAMEYKEEVAAKYDELKTMKEKFEAQSVLMPKEIKEKKKQQIEEMEKAVKELQKKYFGPEGELFKQREDLIKPIQEKIYNAISEIAEEKNYAFVFDKAGSLSILYVQSRYDISDDVLDKVGAVMGTTRREDRRKGPKTKTSAKKKNSSQKKTMSSPPGKGLMPPSFGGRRK